MHAKKIYLIIFLEVFMEWLKRLNKAIDYIEDNLCGTVSIEEAARIACCSVYHFQRMFSYISEVSLAEYIRRRRMTAAAFEIQSSNAKIIDIAYKYGYESPTSFNRAFQSIHGISPVNARLKGTMLKAYPRMSLSVTIKGNTVINYRIEKKEAFRITGLRKNLKTDIEDNFKNIPVFWADTKKSKIFPELCRLITPDFPKILGVSVYENKENLICKLYKEGIKNSDICKQCHCSTNTISKIIDKYNIPRRAVRKTNKDFTKFYNLDNPETQYWIGYICADGNIEYNKN